MSTNRNTGPDDEAGEVITSIRLSRAEHSALKALALSEHRNMSQQVRVLVAQAIAEKAAA